MASCGTMIQMNGCDNVLIENLELDGNIDHTIIGGEFNTDGLQIDYDGIFMNACTNVTFLNDNVHHFGRDGIYIIYKYCPNPMPVFPPPNIMNCRILSSQFTYNGRNAMSWGGGTGLFVNNCEFSFSGQSRLFSQPGAGLDIEYENSNFPNSSGVFRNTRFRYNKYHGLISDAGLRRRVYVQYNTFSFCDFVGSEHGDCAWPNAPQFRFNFCNFYGKIQQPYSNITKDPSTDPRRFDDCEFHTCGFFETYNDLDLNDPPECYGLHYFSFTEPETFYNGSWSIITPSPVAIHEPLIEFTNATRVFLDHCNVSTDLTNKLIYLANGIANVSSFNRNKINGTTFTSNGMNFDKCDRDLTSIYHTNIGTHNVGFRWSTSYRPGTCNDGQFWQFFATYGATSCGVRYSIPYAPILYNYPYGFYWTYPTSNPNIIHEILTGKFMDIIDVHTAMPLFSAPCSTPVAWVNPDCSVSSERHGKKITPEQQNSLYVFPTITLDELTIRTSKTDEVCRLVDVFGSTIIDCIRIDKEVKINVAELKSGVYFIVSNTAESVKFIKQ